MCMREPSQMSCVWYLKCIRMLTAMQLRVCLATIQHYMHNSSHWQHNNGGQLYELQNKTKKKFKWGWALAEKCMGTCLGQYGIYSALVKLGQGLCEGIHNIPQQSLVEHSTLQLQTCCEGMALPIYGEDHSTRHRRMLHTSTTYLQFMK